MKALILSTLVLAAVIVGTEARILREGEPDVVRYFDQETFDSLRSELLSRMLGTRRNEDSGIVEVTQWPPAHITSSLGQVSGVAVDSRGLVYIFHRGATVWDAQSFNMDNVYSHPDKFIDVPTIWVLDPKSGKVLKRWGENMFLMPHGLYIDPEDNVWVTDVGLHQVFKFPKNETKPSLVLGEALVPGDDSAHFCKPTDVAVLNSGVVFIGDGYCNQRVAVFNGEGQFLTDIGRADGMLVPHSITLLEGNDTLCVADRENSRILCYATGLSTNGEYGLGDIKFANADESLGKVYAIAGHGNRLYGVEVYRNGQPHAGFVTEVLENSPIQTFTPKEPFVLPHDIALSPDGSSIYVVDAGSKKKIYKFIA
ncbi:peptidyl-alpha-hydroxyglycine alpha-amidating lyase 2-like [Ornithodoros turicata]|uniref:peptidyl-alpha-hydroxyglycine alpha-amidating lyase 2-like n=1 Tax=Ornithodoros turicata TaxID=34597 RepID=UPI00313960EC